MAIQASNNDVEGRLLEFSGREFMVRGRGYLKSIDDIEQVAVTRGRRVRRAVLVRATWRRSPSARAPAGRGRARRTRRGRRRHRRHALRRERAWVIDRVKARLAEVQGALPRECASSPPTIARASFAIRFTPCAERCSRKRLSCRWWLAFLFHFRSALIPIIAAGGGARVVRAMYYLGVSSNILMSLGGLALAIGELVDLHRDGGKRGRHITEPDGRPATVPIEDQPAA
jgi:Cu(I)/Ag(I) efflux system membrane protein CusA/SilA